MPGIEANRNRMLAIITTVLATAALRASYPVTMPLTASILRFGRSNSGLTA